MTAGRLDRAGALAPLVDALLDAAQRDADALLAQADDNGARARSEARERAARLLDESRAKGTADGEAVLAAERARAERQARGLVLRARGDVFSAARREARDAVSRLTERPDYPPIATALAELAREQLGDGASVTEAASGGVVAAAGGRGLDLSLGALADDLVDDHADEVLGTWSP